VSRTTAVRWSAALLLAAACAAGRPETLPPARPALENPGFDEEGDGLAGWAVRGESHGRARVVGEPSHSRPGALELEAKGAGSSGDRSLMVYQVLDPARYRGRRVQFGARVRTAGGAVNLALYTPEKMANDFFEDLHSNGWVRREGVLDVPAGATFLSFGIQVFGRAGAKAWVDDVFVAVEGGNPVPAPPAPPPGSKEGRAEVRVDAARPAGLVNELVFGMHLEWPDRGNGLVDAAGALRREPLDALRALRLPLFRFPGGIHADYYDWRQGTAPVPHRPPATNVFTRKREPQPFGTPELAALLRETAAQALVTANYGTGNAERAGAWARDLAGRKVPAAYWEVGNEIYLADPGKDQPNGRAIAKSPEQYAKDFPAFRDAIRAGLPGARVGLIAHLDTAAFPLAPAAVRDWSTRMLAALRGKADFVSVHDAYAPVVIDDSVRFDDPAARLRVYRALYAAPAETIENLRAVEAELDRRPLTRGLPIAVTELGPLFGYSTRPEVHAAYVDQSRTMAAAVYVASLLHTLLGEPRVLLACYTNPIHRWYGSLLTDTPEGLVRTPSYWVYDLFRNRLEPRLVATTVEGPTFDAEGVGLVRPRRAQAELLARASLSDDGRRLSALLVNRSLERRLVTRLHVVGFAAAEADCRLLAAASPNAVNGPRLTGSTVAATPPVAPAKVPCRVGEDVVVPPSSVLSLVARGRLAAPTGTDRQRRSR
jgi:hypothetical protein